ncbi:hypothetical protein BH11PLA1_BH11PLA1_00920 [soil metagenome]
MNPDFSCDELSITARTPNHAAGTDGVRRQVLSAMGLAGVAGLAGALALSRSANAGPLTPAAGAPVSTGHTVDEIYTKIAGNGGMGEARTALSSATTPGDATAVFVISQPGSYYLTGNLTPTGGRDGIRVTADYVTIDLNGFTIDGSLATGFMDGIDFSGGTRRGCCVRNGIVRACKGYGIVGNVTDALFIDLAVLDNQSGSLEVFSATNTVVMRVRARAATGEVCISVGNGSVVTECTCEGAGTAIEAQLSCVISRCTARNVRKGFLINSGRVEECALDTVTDTSSFSSGGIMAGTGTEVVRCSLRQCTQAGINASGAISVTDCTFSLCGVGVLVPAFGSGRVRVERNFFHSCTGAGVRLTQPRNFVAGNRFLLNTVDIDAPSSPNTLGEMLDFSAGGVLTAANAHPFANIRY